MTTKTRRFVDLDDGTRVALTHHAEQRRIEMRLCSPDIRAILTSPDEITTSRKYPGEKVYRRGDHALATFVDDRGVLVVKTALYASLAAWRRADRMGHLPGDRIYRPDLILPEHY